MALSELSPFFKFPPLAQNKNDWERCECDHINGLTTARRASTGLPPRTTNTTITTKEPDGLMLHEFSRAWHSKLRCDQVTVVIVVDFIRCVDQLD
jgi:hypothetical protein